MVLIAGCVVILIGVMPPNVPPVVVITPSHVLTVATSSPPAVSSIATASEKTATSLINVPEKTWVTTTTVVTITQTSPPISISASTTTPVTTSTESNTVGTTTLAVQSIPLLVGGTVHAGQTVPISYLQITNIGQEGALLKGFWVQQNGSAPVQSVIGLTTVDDQGGSRGSVGGTEGFVLFKDGLAFAPTEITTFAPGQMRLFTIKAVLVNNVSYYRGTQLMIEVVSIDTNAKVAGSFPIRGTTWTIQ